MAKKEILWSTNTEKNEYGKFKSSLDGEVLSSRWAKDIYDFFKKLNISVERDVSISSYVVDFKVDNYLLSCDDSLISDVDSEKLEAFREAHVIFISSNKSLFGKPNSYDSNGLRYQHKCLNPIIGIDIDLFRDPGFPYAVDRPKCFYNVRVDGKKSSLEAWPDCQLRWDMIKNRIEYSGGFIDSKQVLGALNITRNCKQPSWFSKQLAINIIKNYATTDVIADPFAGWGARCDASKELGKTYIGSDFNEELVEWHKSLGRNVEFRDANEFFYDGECTVFICPPYSDPKTGRCFEDYNFNGFDDSAKAKSQCDWLKLCMKNIPNAKEYIMVCKVVDEGFDKFIINTKVNKSHFGINNEYILVINNDEAKHLI